MAIWRITYHAQKYSATMHDYYLVTLSESLIFLGFSRLLAFELMGVIWREEKLHPKIRCEKIENPSFPYKIRVYWCFCVAIYH